MTQSIVNLALPVVRAKILHILPQYPASPHQLVLAEGDWHQKLVAYVLTRMPSIYATVDDSVGCDWRTPGNCYSAEQHQQIGALIHQGIEHLMAQYQAHTETGTEVGAVPSSWFG
jgi:hypothetical protein